MSLNIELQPQVLRWVRERAGLTREDLADKLDTTPEKVSAWEQDGKITFKRAQDLAEKVHAPFGFLYLPEPFVEGPLFRICGQSQAVDFGNLVLISLKRFMRRSNAKNGSEKI